jgi:hypothetical protein|nr:MAG TPA: hypothetical protein [Crassvirales sp.]
MEFILCSAIKRLIPREVDCKYYNNDINRIEIGFRHHDILIRFKWEVSDDAKDQGFLTSHGRFVNREEGYKIALEAGQITEKYDKTLYSEDLY